jgi:putative nucleotidyltransferase with HDIG domain
VTTAGAIDSALPVWITPTRPAISAKPELRKAEIVSALSFGLDLATGLPVGHSVRACLLGMRLAREIGLNDNAQSDLYYALLLKDAGCSSNASKLLHVLGSDDVKAKRDIKDTDWTRLSWEVLDYALAHIAPGKPLLDRMRVWCQAPRDRGQESRAAAKIRCERGANVARLIGLPDRTARGIASLDEHWDGRGEPAGLRKAEIPILSRIMLLSQTLEIFHQTCGAEAAINVARERSKRWFDPDLVKAAESLAQRNVLWNDLASEGAFSLAVELDTRQETLVAGESTLDAICLAFAEIVDAKSPFTYQHSNGVANAAVAIARTLNLRPEKVLFIRHAALLHDLGKLGVSNEILEKPGKLDENEWRSMRLHPFYTWKILNSISGFGELSEIAASHHEKLDGSGYFRGLHAAQLPLESRILVVADIFDALSAKRPYRDSLPLEKVFEIMRKDAPQKLDIGCIEALETSGANCDHSFVDLQTLSERLILSNFR